MSENMKAFPTPPVFNREDFVVDLGNKGMDLRDWFAGEALAQSIHEYFSCGASAPGETPQTAAEEIANSAYQVADAMMERRKIRAKE